MNKSQKKRQKGFLLEYRLGRYCNQHSTSSNTTLLTLVSMASKSEAMNWGVSDWRKTSICCSMDDLSSSSGFSFLMSAITYLDSAAGSASHLQG